MAHFQSANTAPWGSRRIARVSVLGISVASLRISAAAAFASSAPISALFPATIKTAHWRKLQARLSLLLHNRDNQVSVVRQILDVRLPHDCQVFAQTLRAVSVSEATICRYPWPNFPSKLITTCRCASQSCQVANNTPIAVATFETITISLVFV